MTSRFAPVIRPEAPAPPQRRPAVAWAPVYKSIDLSVVFGASGQLIRIDDLTARSGMGHAERKMRVPRTAEAPGGMAANFLWGRSRYALGARRPRNAAHWRRVEDPTFQGFSRFHRLILDETPDLALQAFLKFLDGRSPALAEAIPMLGDKLDPNVVFRFQYDDDFLHDRPAARRIWQPLAMAEIMNSDLDEPTLA